MQRNDFWYFRQAVPKSLIPTMKKRQIWKSLKTKNKKEALAKACDLISHYYELFKCPPDQFSKKHITFTQVQAAAKAYEFQYRPYSQIEEASLPEAILMMRETLSLIENLKAPDIVTTAAIAGAITPTLSLDAMLERFWELSEDKLINRDKRNIENKKSRYRSAVTDFKTLVGDIDVLNMTAKQAFQYATRLTALIRDGKLKSDTAKHKIRYISAAIKKVFKADFPDMPNPFDKVRIEYSGDEGKRKPLTTIEVSAIYEEMERCKANEELVAIIKIMEGTGCHAKEICLLDHHDIHLDAPIPYISIRANVNRKHLKTNGARHREIPLIGAALDAAKLFPKGFPTYCRSGGSDAVSAAANKHIKKIAAGKTSYGYRHRMTDLLRSSNAQDSMIRAILGHEGDMTDHYGNGHSLEKKQTTLSNALKLKN